MMYALLAILVYMVGVRVGKRMQRCDRCSIYELRYNSVAKAFADYRDEIQVLIDRLKGDMQPASDFEKLKKIKMP